MKNLFKKNRKSTKVNGYKEIAKIKREKDMFYETKKIRDAERKNYHRATFSGLYLANYEY